VNCERHAGVIVTIFLGALVFFSFPMVLHAKDIRIAVPSKSLVFLPLYVGVAQRHFQSEGHNPRVILMQSSLAMSALVSGEIDYATSFGSGIRAAVSGLPVRGVAVYMKTTPFFLIANPAISSVRDLKGKKIGITSFGSATHATARAVLRLQQMDPDKDVTFVAMGTEPTFFAALMNGAIDASVLTPPYDARAKLAGYRELGYSGDVLPEPSSGIMVSLKKIQSDPAEIREVLAASLKSIQFIIKEKRETVDLIAKEWKVDPPVAAASYESITRALAENGIADQTAIERMIQDAKLLTKSTREVSINDVIDFTLVRQAQKSLK
jgi:NitT/TauT family transport system substrate-binding protein